MAKLTSALRLDLSTLGKLKAMGSFPDKAKLKNCHTPHTGCNEALSKILSIILNLCMLFDYLCSTCIFRRGDSPPKFYRGYYAGERRSNVCITVSMWYCVHVLQVTTISSSCSELIVSAGIVAPFDRKPRVQDYVSLSL